jgi:hypothetical protein
MARRSEARLRLGEFVDRDGVGPLALSAGPALEGLVRPIVVQYSGREVFRVPELVASVQIDASLGD